MPATETDFEREFEELVRELRALPTAAPEQVRERVRALGEPTKPPSLFERLLAVPSYGGYVVSLEQSTAPGRPGQADLVFRVPVARVEDALMRLADLGTVIDRHLSIRDLEQVVQQQ